MNNPVYLVVRREYLERVRTRSFIITTLLFPLIMMAMMCVPVLIAVFSQPEKQTIAVVDNSGEIAPLLRSTPELTFVHSTAPADSLKTDEAYDAVLVIGPDVLKDPSDIAMFQHQSGSISTEGEITSMLEKAIEKRRIDAYDIPELEKIMQSVQADVTIKTYRISDGSEDETSSLASYIVSIVMTMVLYMFILMYGQQILTSIVEEKNNRVLEVVVSSMSPTKLLMGKILGVGAVAVTQLLIWAALLLTFAGTILPALGTDLDMGGEFAAAINAIGSPEYVARIFVYMGLYLVGGFLLYAAVFGAIGSAIDNIQDATQLTTLAMSPIIIGIMLGMGAASNPMGGLAFWGSIIPFTSPMVMMARAPYDVPLWQVILSLALLYASALLTIWVAAKIYRVGIFMYGQKPNIKTLIRMARQ